VTRLWPQLTVRRGREAVAFYQQAFAATEEFRVGGDDENESVVSQLAVGDARFWVSDEAPEFGNVSPETVGGGTVRLLLLVDDPDTVVACAVAAGARETMAVAEQYGWRLGRIEDPYGHSWEIGTPLGDWPGLAG
jgi:PhnB protein